MGLLKCLLEVGNPKPSNFLCKNRVKQSRVMTLEVCVIMAGNIETQCKWGLLKENEFLKISKFMVSFTIAAGIYRWSIILADTDFFSTIGIGIGRRF